MGRRRGDDSTSTTRYMLKMYRIFACGVPPDLAMKVAEALARARELGYAPYKIAWDHARSVMLRYDVPKALWGLYRSFVYEFVNKVIKRRQMTKEELIMEWINKGLERSVLEALVNEITDVVREHLKTSETKAT